MMHRAWSSIVEVPYCFSRSYVKFQGHTAPKIVKFDPNWAFPDCNSSFNSPMAMKCCTKLETAKERCPIVFQSHPSNFKVTRDKTSPIFYPNWAFPDYRPFAAFKSLRFALLDLITPLKYENGMAWKCAMHFWPFMRGLFQTSMDSPHKGLNLYGTSTQCILCCQPEQAVKQAV